VVSVALARLVLKRSIREGGVNQEHVRRLMRLGGRWPPILVHEETGVVIDGVHRVAAARMLGLLRIDASLFKGGPDAALIESVRRNVQHGLPLTLRERKWAATQVLRIHPDWSDRRIAGICALSPKTVGRLRAHHGGGADGVPQLDASVRVGRDNRLRPVNGVKARARVAKALEENPGASLRSVAAKIGVSPETVRSVRLSLAATTTDTDTQDGAEEVASAAVGDVPAGSVFDVISDESPSRRLAAVPDNTSAVAEFLEWFERTAVDADMCSRWALQVPLAYSADIAAEAHLRGQAWLDFAASLNTRAESSA
jgi:ParB-like chromosome segregation protein Spo0J